MSVLDSRGPAALAVLAMVSALVLAGCTPGEIVPVAKAGNTIAKFFAGHADKLTGEAKELKQAARSLVDDGLRDSTILAARDAEVQTAHANSETHEALTKVCNIYVDFSNPTPEDSVDDNKVIALLNSAKSEMPGSGIKAWSERLASAYALVFASGDAQKQAALTLKRDAEVAAFQYAYCKS